MTTVTVANVKGGTGKTLASVCLAYVFHQLGEPVLLMDGDLQGSATRWATNADEAGERLPFDVVQAPAASDLLHRFDAIAQGRHVVIDCAPGNADFITEAIDLADVAVIPVNASEDDVHQAGLTTTQCRASGIPHGVLFSRIRPSESLPGYYRSELTEAGNHVFDTMIYELVRFRAFGGRIDDLRPFDALHAEVMKLEANA